MFKNIISFFTGNLSVILGGALAVSLLGNVVQGVMVNHYAGKAAACKTSVVAANKAATEKKVIVEKRQDKNVSETQDRVSDRITRASREFVTPSGGVRNGKGRVLDQPAAEGSPSGTDGKSGAAILLPDGSTIDEVTYLNDQRVCVVNTIKAEEWQKFYTDQINIWEEENVGNTDK